MGLYIELSHCGLNRRVTIMPPLSNQFCQYLYSMHVNSLWHSDAIWCYVSTFTQVIRARRIQNFSLARLSELCNFFYLLGCHSPPVFLLFGALYCSRVFRCSLKLHSDLLGTISNELKLFILQKKPLITYVGRYDKILPTVLKG